LHLCANYQIIPTNTEQDENLKLSQFNPGIYLDPNKSIPIRMGGFENENKDFKNTVGVANANPENFIMNNNYDLNNIHQNNGNY